MQCYAFVYTGHLYRCHPPLAMEGFHYKPPLLMEALTLNVCVQCVYVMIKYYS